jgi:hypothetical protein
MRRIKPSRDRRKKDRELKILRLKMNIPECLKNRRMIASMK